jgi:diguanylate cyclase (GGDEF)-like protein
MKLDRGFLRSRVARRVLAWFMLSAFVPVLALVALSSQELKAMLDAQSREQIAEATSAYGHEVYDRLLAADAALHTWAWSAIDRGSFSRANARETGFARLIVVGADGTREAFLGTDVGPLPHVDGAAEAHLAGGASYLAAAVDGAGAGHIFMLRKMAARPGALLVAELDQTALWGDPDSYPYLTRFCASVGSPVFILHCTSPRDRAALQEIQVEAGNGPDRSPRLLRWQDDGGAMLGYAKDFFLLPRFGVPSWTFVAIQPEARGLEPARRFKAVFGLVAVLALLIVALLSVTSIRRTLVPLERLINGTRRIARREFSSPVEVIAQDEFGELATSMNSMARQLERQFNMFGALAEVDRLILTALEVDRVIETVLHSLTVIVEADVAGITLIEAKDGLFHTRSWCNNAASHSGVEHGLLEPEFVEILRQRSGGLEVTDEPGRGTAVLRRLREGGATHFFVFPVTWQKAVCAILIAGWRGAGKVDEDVVARMRALGDRISVALSAASREEQLYRQAHYDALSELPNRWLFKDRLKQELARARWKDHRLAVLFIDLDRFKTVNDTQGHEAGDEVLRLAAARLRGALRASDTVARFGGDEFAVILPGLPSPSHAANIAENLLQALSKPYPGRLQEHYLGASIGIAIAPDDGDTVELLLRNADMAMYRAKDEGRGRFVFFESRMTVETVKRLSLERDLRRAIAGSELLLHYQPQMRTADGAIVGAEALVRWNHPELGLLLPDRFIGLAEETGLIEALGEWVLLEGARQHRVWRGAGLAPRLAVNVAGRQFRNPRFVDTVKHALKDSGMPAHALELELTENVLISDTDAAVHTMQELARLGVRIAIDDFGTGYSSMAYLKHLPGDVLKIDRSFVKDIESDADAAEIARAIIVMGHMLRRQIVAEGVETASQLAVLREWGCDQIQGYWLSRPLEAAAFVRWMHAYPRRRAEREVADVASVDAEVADEAKEDAEVADGANEGVI